VNVRCHMRTCVTGFMLAACEVLGPMAAHAAEGDVQWRVSDQDDSALLVTADSEATDNFGSLLFHCRKGSGIAIAEGDMSDDLRTTIAAMILHDEEPAVTMVPDDPSAVGVEAFTGTAGWNYRFRLAVTGPAFQQFERTGSFRFKLGDSSVSSEFKVGLENVRKFQDLCKRPST
jgi:hypothetical protein